ncbi:MAG: TetR/AcrR family transcriptional regulator [Propionicimonas sp.]|nr:TetR/AcrR family transcriptional regulator [Propionicimonas sp.]
MVTPRERARERTMAEIRALAWKQVEELGAPALSLRAIARDLGVVSSAIYRYVASRDDLLTALLVEGFSDLAEAADAAEAAVPADAYRERWLAICRAMRAWALERPAAWGLLYGGPVPGYFAPQQETSPPGTRVLLRLAAAILEAKAAGRLEPKVGPAAGISQVSPQQRLALEAISADRGVPVDAELVALGILGWTAVLGVISSEVFEQLGPDGAPAVALLADIQFESIADAVGF